MTGRPIDRDEVLAERYSDLPESTRRWLEQLRVADIETLEEAQRMYEKTKTLGTVAKWMLLTIIGIFITAASLGDSIIRMITWLRGHP